MAVLKDSEIGGDIMLWDKKMIEKFVKGNIVVHFKDIKTDKTELLIKTFLEKLDEYNVMWSTWDKASEGLDFFLGIHALYGSDCLSCNHLEKNTLEHDVFNSMKRAGFKIVEFDGFIGDENKKPNTNTNTNTNTKPKAIIIASWSNTHLDAGIYKGFANYNIDFPNLPINKIKHSGWQEELNDIKAYTQLTNKPNLLILSRKFRTEIIMKQSSMLKSQGYDVELYYFKPHFDELIIEFKTLYGVGNNLLERRIERAREEYELFDISISILKDYISKIQEIS